MKKLIRKFCPTARKRIPQINFLRRKGIVISYSAAYKMFCSDKEFNWLIDMALAYGLSHEDRVTFRRKFYVY